MAEIVQSVKNQDKRTQVELMKRLMRIRQNLNSCLLKQKKEKTCRRKNKSAVAGFLSFRERESFFSLDFPSFGPSVRFGPTSKAVLRYEGYAWTPIWWSSDNSKR